MPHVVSLICVKLDQVPQLDYLEYLKQFFPDHYAIQLEKTTNYQLICQRRIGSLLSKRMPLLLRVNILYNPSEEAS